MKRVVSISLGSSKRDKTTRLEVAGQEFEISRIGTDGDMKRFAEMMRELDGNVDAIGLGGVDRYLWTDRGRYVFKDVDRLARIARVTPVVDGSGVKNTLERWTVEWLQDNGIVDFRSKKVMVLSAVDRFGIAQAVSKLSRDVIYGDLMFALGIPIPMRSYATVRILAALLLPIITRMPFQWMYPTGEKQEKTLPKYHKYYRWSEVIAGDFHLMRRTMPPVGSGLIDGKTLITNTITPDDARMLAERNLGLLVTAAPEWLRSPDGRYYATNVLEGVLVSLMNKPPREITLQDYEDLLHEMNWKPTLTRIS